MTISKKRKKAGWMLVGYGLVCAVLSAAWFVRTQIFLRSAIRTQATVISLAERRDNDGILYYPTYRFRDSNGADHQIVSSIGSFPPSYAEGEKVGMLYQMSKPEEAELDDFFEIWGAVTIGCGLSTVALVAGIAYLIAAKNSTSPQTNSTLR